ncbi:MAG: PorV/PorQ family protein [Flavobacteriaceae bacterium]|nr:PorV/PorQ family protein [Flavobacteriaceae bacterium]
MKHLLFIILFITPLVYSQTTRKYSNEFLSIGVDAASFGMGKAVVATSKDVNSIYWNPAGLLSIEGKQASLMHAEYFAGIAKYDYAGYAFSLDNQSALGISVIRFGVDDILNTTELIDSQGNINYNRIRLFSAADYALNIAYARELKFNNLKFGVNSKIVRRIIGDFATSWGVGFDIGLQFEKEKWKYGLMLRDITTTFNAWSIDQAGFEKIKNAIPNQNQEMPETVEITLPKAQIGIARNFEINRDLNLLTEIDLNIRFSKTNDIIATNLVSIEPSFGFQLDFLELIYLRAGINNIQKKLNFDATENYNFQPNFGIGFNYQGIQLDYALTNIANVGNALYSNVFSLKVDFEYFK